MWNQRVREVSIYPTTCNERVHWFEEARVQTGEMLLLSPFKRDSVRLSQLRFASQLL